MNMRSYVRIKNGRLPKSRRPHRREAARHTERSTVSRSEFTAMKDI